MKDDLSTWLTFTHSFKRSKLPDLATFKNAIKAEMGTTYTPELLKVTNKHIKMAYPGDFSYIFIIYLLSGLQLMADQVLRIDEIEKKHQLTLKLDAL